jgi:hypothetical protein
MRRLRKCSKGWNINVEGRYKRLRRGLLDKVAAIDIKSESLGFVGWRKNREDGMWK